MFNWAGGQGHEKPFGYYRDLLWGQAMSGGPVKRSASPPAEVAAIADAEGRLPCDTGPIGAAASGSGFGGLQQSVQWGLLEIRPGKVGLEAFRPDRVGGAALHCFKYLWA